MNWQKKYIYYSDENDRNDKNDKNDKNDTILNYERHFV